tara:strand:+ start:184 stop:603 length:420 start_codon:yes stop_codon:yes gene_type:complete
MSAQTIMHPSIASIKKDAEDLFISSTTKLILKDDYGLGNSYCEFDMIDACMMYEIISINNCTINCVIQQQIDSIGDEEEYCSTYDEDFNLNLSTGGTASSSTTDSLYQLWLSRGNSGTEVEFSDLLLKDEDVQLLQNNW